MGIRAPVAALLALFAALPQDAPELGRFRREPLDAAPVDPFPVARLDKGSFNHPAPVQAATVSQDGRILVTLDSAGVVTGWDRASRQQLFFRGILPKGFVPHRLFCSPNGKWVGVAPRSSVPSAVIVLDILTGNEIRKVDRCGAAVFSADGSVLAGCDGRFIRRWDVANGDELRRLEEKENSQSHVALSPDGKLLVASDESSAVLGLWDTGTGLRVWQSDPNRVRGAVSEMVFSPDGKTFAVGYLWGLDLWSVSGDRLTSLRGLDSVGGPPLRYSRDGKTLVSGMNRKQVEIWNMERGEQTAAWVIPFAAGEILELSESGSVLLRVSGGGVRLEDILGPQKPPLTCVSFTPEGRVITGGVDGRVQVWNPLTGEEVAVFQVPRLAVQSFSRDGRSVLLAAGEKSLTVWDLAAGKERLKIELLRFVTAAALSPDGAIAAVASLETGIVLWDVSGKKEKGRIVAEGEVSAVAWSADGRSIAWGDSSGSIGFAEGARGLEPLRLQPRGRRITALAIPKEGGSVLTSDGNGTLRLWFGELGREPVEVGVRETPSPLLAVSPDGAWAAVSSDQRGGMRLYSTKGDRRIVEYQGNARSINSIAFSPDGTFVAAAGGGGEALVWRVYSKP